jgi:hypothetical protein
MKTVENIQETLHNYFTKVIEDSKPVDYSSYVEEHKSEIESFTTLPEGTVVVAVQDESGYSLSLIVRTPDTKYLLVEDDEVTELEDDEMTEENMYEIQHYDEYGTHHLFTSYTSFSGYLVYQVTQNLPSELGGYHTL